MTRCGYGVWCYCYFVFAACSRTFKKHREIYINDHDLHSLVFIAIDYCYTDHIYYTGLLNESLHPRLGFDVQELADSIKAVEE